MIDYANIIHERDDEWDESAENEPTDWPDDDVYRGEGDLEC